MSNETVGAGLGGGRKHRWRDNVLEEETDAGWLPVRPTAFLKQPGETNGHPSVFVESATALAAGRLVGKPREWRVEKVTEFLQAKHCQIWGQHFIGDDKALTETAEWLVDTGLEIEAWLHERV